MNSMGLHGGDEPGIMSVDAEDLEPVNESLPMEISIRPIFQQDECAVQTLSISFGLLE
jgi:hypothetical protein